MKKFNIDKKNLKEKMDTCGLIINTHYFEIDKIDYD